VAIGELLKIGNKDPYLKVILKDKGIVSFIKDYINGHNRQ
jgi:hypothetical protein